MRIGAISIIAALGTIALSAPAKADALDVLRGKYGFNWRSEPSRQKCMPVAGQLLADFKSTKYRCDLKAKSNTSSGGSARTCAEVKKGGKEYLIFDTRRACENEREAQESNE